MKELLTNYGFVINSEVEEKAAVFVYQRLSGLQIDGIAGPKTKTSLLNVKPSDRFIKPILWLEPSVSYRSQRDNLLYPDSTCNTTCMAMICDYLSAQSFPNNYEDEITKLLETPEAYSYFKKNFVGLEGYKPRTVHGMLVWAFNKLGLTSKFKLNASLKDIADFHQPVIVSGPFTSSGHMITVVGQTIDHDLIVHDPWGDWNTSYKDKSGQFKIYPKEKINFLLKTHFVQTGVQ